MKIGTVPVSLYHPVSLYLLRSAAVACALIAWFWTQSLIGSRGFPVNGQIVDGVHLYTASLHQYLLSHPIAANWLLILSSLVIDMLAIFLLASSIFGSSMRPFFELLSVFALRQICQGLCALPPPEGMLWFYPGFPSLLVTYGVATDLFFSGHTAIAVLGAVELARLPLRGTTFLGIFIALFEASTVLVLRAHYFMDVFTGAAVALLIAYCFREMGRSSERAGNIDLV